MQGCFPCRRKSRTTKEALRMAVPVIIELAWDGTRGNIKVKIFIANGSLRYDAVVFSVGKDTCVQYNNVRPT